jgi:hypothetical protein
VGFKPTTDFSVVPVVVATMTPSEPQEVLQDWMAGMPGIGNWLLGGLLEEHKAPTLTAALSAATTVEGLKDLVKGLAAGVMQLVNGLLGGTNSEGQHTSHEGQPFAAAAVEGLKDLAKGLASGVTQLVNGLLGSTNTFNGTSEAPSSAFVVLLGVFALFTLLLRSGEFSWPPHEFIKPASALRPAIERPG